MGSRHVPLLPLVGRHSVRVALGEIWYRPGQMCNFQNPGIVGNVALEPLVAGFEIGDFWRMTPPDIWRDEKGVLRMYGDKRHETSRKKAVFYFSNKLLFFYDGNAFFFDDGGFAFFFSPSSSSFRELAGSGYRLQCGARQTPQGTTCGLQSYW